MKRHLKHLFADTRVNAETINQINLHPEPGFCIEKKTRLKVTNPPTDTESFLLIENKFYFVHNYQAAARTDNR